MEPLNIPFSEFKVQASYRGEGEYTLALAGEDHTHIEASGSIEWEGLDKQSLRLRGAIGDHKVSAAMATVGGTIHIFTRVRNYSSIFNFAKGFSSIITIT